MALWINGNTVIPTNRNWPKKYIKEIYKICNADLIINGKFYNELSIFTNKQNILTLKKKFQILKKLKFKNNIPYIIFTSGTTSKQKGGCNLRKKLFSLY